MAGHSTTHHRALRQKGRTLNDPDAMLRHRSILTAFGPISTASRLAVQRPPRWPLESVTHSSCSPSPSRRFAVVTR